MLCAIKKITRDFAKMGKERGPIGGRPTLVVFCSPPIYIICSRDTPLMFEFAYILANYNNYYGICQKTGQPNDCSYLPSNPHWFVSIPRLEEQLLGGKGSNV